MNKNKQLIRYLVYGGAILLIVTLFSLYQQKTKQPTEKINIKPTGAIAPKRKGIIKVGMQDNRVLVGKGETLSLVVVASSGGVEVNGYDVVLQYDPEVVQFIDVQPIETDFDSVSTVSDNALIITGSLKLSKEVSPVLKDNALSIIRFKTLREGSPRFALDFINGSMKDTNLATSKAEDILGSVTNPLVRVVGTQKITKGRPLKVGPDLTLELQEITVPPKDCFDCFTQVNIVATGEKGSETLLFKNGGLAGVIDQKRTSSGYVIEIGDISGDSLDLYAFRESQL
ncbi:MAG: hypothetical protein UZ21_OP11001000377 [Microgenomates bacterium OLB22]|nr:MAG: hypothetical protein UZ21_OP11001000377 [Microgenomates bacterium OLB22]